MWKYLSFCFIFCAVIEINCWSGDNSDGYRNSEYTRNKRAKYYSFPSIKYYSRSPYSYAIKSPFTYSSSLGYSSNDVDLATSKLKPYYKVSKRPIINKGLGDEDFSDIMKYLSNRDLNKIVEYAAEKESYSDKYRDSDNFEYHGGDFDINDFKKFEFEEDSPKFYLSDPNKQSDYNTPNRFVNHFLNTNYPQRQAIDMRSQIPFNIGEETKFSSLDEYRQKEINVMSNENNIFTDSSIMKEEELPKPLNLREDDYDVSFTNNVVSVAKPETSYRLGNFADLPLMGYEHSKLEKVNSYSVPHYSVISSSSYQPQSPSPAPLQPTRSSSSSSFSSSILSLINAPEVEPAPPVSTAKGQSDAHLKAIKIWTHKSKGTAYTLHDDGTLSLEQPSRPQYKIS